MNKNMTSEGIHEKVVKWFSMDYEGSGRWDEAKEDWVPTVVKGFGRDKPTTHDYDIVIAIMELIDELPASHGMTSVSKILTGKAKTCTKKKQFGMLLGVKGFSQGKVLKLCFEVENYLEELNLIKKDHDYNDGQQYDAMTKETDELVILLLVESFKEAKALYAVTVEAPVKTKERSSEEYKKAFMNYLPNQRDLFLEEAEKLLAVGDFDVLPEGYNQTYPEVYKIYKKREKMRFSKYSRSKKKTGTSCGIMMDLCFFKKDNVESRNNNGHQWNHYGHMGVLKLMVDIDDDLKISNPRFELKKVDSYLDLLTGAFVLEFEK